MHDFSLLSHAKNPRLQFRADFHLELEQKVIAFEDNALRTMPAVRGSIRFPPKIEL